MKRIAPVWIVLLFAAGLAAAAPPRPPAPLTIDLPFKMPVAVAVLDARPDIVNGRRRETFIGFTRTLYGVPVPAQNRTGQTFALDLAQHVTRSLEAGGTPAQTIAASPSGGRQGAVQALQASGAERLVLIEIRDWWKDSLIRTDLHYDLQLSVLDAQGQVLGWSTVTGEDTLGKDNRPERRNLEVATSDILATLFAAKPVLAAFSPDAAPTAAPAAGCTVEQILKMKDAGLTQQQIEAACGSTPR